MTYLLDTNSCVNHLRLGQASNVTTSLAATASGEVVLCSVVVAELLYGAHRSARKVQTTVNSESLTQREDGSRFAEQAVLKSRELVGPRLDYSPASLEPLTTRYTPEAGPPRVGEFRLASLGFVGRRRTVAPAGCRCVGAPRR